MSKIRQGDYVLAAQWDNGMHRNLWSLGFYSHTAWGYHFLNDVFGSSICTPYRRMQKVTPAQGDWILSNVLEIRKHRVSIWWFYQE